ncbi:MAG: M36 family metallopeptidase [Caldilineaceae bacterium]
MQAKDAVSLPAPQPTGQPPGFLTGPNAGDPHTIAVNYLRQKAPSYGLSAEDLNDMIVVSQYTTQYNGVTHIVLRQRHLGIELYNGDMAVNIGPDGAVLNVGNRFAPNLARTVNTDAPELSATGAVERAAAHLKLTLTAPLRILEEQGGAARAATLSDGGISKAAIPALLVYQRLPDGQVRLAWLLDIEQTDGQHIWHLRVDAVNGEILGQNDLILRDFWSPMRSAPPRQTIPTPPPPTDQPPSPVATPSYRVFPLPLEHPNDGPGLPTSHTLLESPADEVASPYGWHDVDGLPGHEYADTRGNNVWAQEDRNDDDANGFRPTGVNPAAFNFDYPFDPLVGPVERDNPAAAITNLFYWNNILHDITYRYGFDEASGNFQQNNYARGGEGFDAVQADAQDGYDWGYRNNAYFMITSEGYPPRLGMFIFDYTIPNRDSSLDNGIIAHEYTHGISTRLVGGPYNAYCLYNDEQMGEGWSDWFTLALTTDAGDVGSQGRALGTYVLGDPPEGPGIRQYPYSTDMNINPLTYGQMAQSGGDIYTIGEIWASMLWEMHWGLVEQYGFDPDFYTGSGGNNVALRLIMDGMKFAPCDPGFVDARDAILLADQVDYGGANQCTIWQAFAKRGLGQSALQGSPYDTRDGVEAFDQPIACLDELMLTKSADPPIAQADGVLTYNLEVGNYLADPLTGVTLRDVLPTGVTYIDGSASDGGAAANGVVTWAIGDLGVDQVVTRTFQVQVDRSLATGAILTNTADVASNEGQTATFSLETEVVSVPDIEVSVSELDVTLQANTQLTQSFAISNVGPAPLEFTISEIDAPISPLPTPAAALMVRAESALPAYTDGHLPPTQPEPFQSRGTGLTSPVELDVLLLAASDAYNIQSILNGYPDLGQIDIYDARYATPTLEQLLPYDAVVVISNETFADAVQTGNVLADYVDAGGAVVQTVAAFYDPYGIGWGLAGRFVDEGYSPFIGVGDWFYFCHARRVRCRPSDYGGVVYAGDYYRQIVELAPDAQWVASWTDDEFVAAKGNVVALNTFLADFGGWEGDVPLIVHNSIVWLQGQDSADRVPWLTTVPISGTVLDGQAQIVDVGFDARAPIIEEAGDLGAQLLIRSNDPDAPRVTIPVTLHVIGPELHVVDTEAYYGRKVTVPITFTNNGIDIAAVAFAVDFDERCLSFDTTDANADGIPDAIQFSVPPGFNTVALADLGDVNGELNIFIGDISPPLTSLPAGQVMTIEVETTCQAKEKPLIVPMRFGRDPIASFSDLTGHTVPGRALEGAVAVQFGLLGDCNQDGLVNAADTVSCVLEIFDGDGSFWLDAPGGDFPGSPQGCDSNRDSAINAGDIVCTILTIFQGPDACQAQVSAAAVNAATLSMPAGIPVQPGGQVAVPVVFAGNGNAAAAAVFALTYDQSQLTLDPTDANGDGIPDAVAFNLPAQFAPNVSLGRDGRIQIAIADLAPPLALVPDGTIATVTFTANAAADGATASIGFAPDFAASLGVNTGASAPVTTSDGSVIIGATEVIDSLEHNIYLPSIVQ